MRNRASRSRWAATRARYAGPRWRRAVYWAARGLALITVGWVVGLGMIIGAGATWAADAITAGLTRVEGWAWPGLYARHLSRRSQREAQAETEAGQRWIEAWAADRTARGARESGPSYAPIPRGVAEGMADRAPTPESPGRAAPPYPPG